MIDLPSPSSVWRQTFKSLQQDFRRAANMHPALRHAVVECLDEEGTIPPGLERIMRDAGGFDAGVLRERLEIPARDQNPQVANAWWMSSLAKVGYLYGPQEARENFQRLAERAWLALPGTQEGKAQGYPQARALERWMEVIYATLAKDPGSYLEADDTLWVCWQSVDGRSHEAQFVPQAVKRETPQGTMIEPAYPEADKLTGVTKRWKYSALATDPCTVSRVVIDVLLAHRDPRGPYRVSSQQSDAYQKSSAFQDANFLVDTILLGDGRAFRICRNYCKPAAGSIPSLCPKADPPAAKADREALLEYLPKIALRYRELHLLGEGQTIHWVGKQARLGTVCKCNLCEVHQQDSGKQVHGAAGTETAKTGGKQSTRSRWDQWALGYDGTRWYLFQLFQREWRQKRFVTGISKGLQTKLLRALAADGGFLEKSKVLKLIRPTYSAGDIDPLMGIIKPALSNLRKLLRSLIGAGNNPLPYDKTRLGWEALIHVGYAVEDDRQNLGGEHRLRFKTVNELTVHESADQVTRF